MVAFLCLGPKRSGDVYTASDLAWVAALADRVSSQLLLFGQGQVIEEGRKMQEALRRYVPSAVAEQLAAGEVPQDGEREVTVLFVDIRGYTAYAERRSAGVIFETINRYIEGVSRIVTRYGGNIVEFNGDGMMAVFGAPRPLPGKERAAVASAREIVAAVAVVATDGGVGALSVGIGVATGVAFVGSVQAADRRIWTALGNTTNLAARLQGLTRDLDAAIALDSATWKAASQEAASFVACPGVVVRGRSEPLDLYILPRDGHV